MTHFLQWSKAASIGDLGIVQGSAWGDCLQSTATEPLKKFRFDPFATFDAYSDKGEMQVESIAIDQLAE